MANRRYLSVILDRIIPTFFKEKYPKYELFVETFLNYLDEGPLVGTGEIDDEGLYQKIVNIINNIDVDEFKNITDPEIQSSVINFMYEQMVGDAAAKDLSHLLDDILFLKHQTDINYAKGTKATFQFTFGFLLGGAITITEVLNEDKLHNGEWQYNGYINYNNRPHKGKNPFIYLIEAQPFTYSEFSQLLLKKLNPAGMIPFVINRYTIKTNYLESNPTENLISNGTFDGKYPWITPITTSWNVSTGGVAARDGSIIANDTISQFSTKIFPGYSYRVKFDVSNYISGTIRPKLGNGLGKLVYSGGSYDDTFFCESNSTFKLETNDFHGEIDNIEITRNVQLYNYNDTSFYVAFYDESDNFISMIKPTSLKFANEVGTGGDMILSDGTSIETSDVYGTDVDGIIPDTGYDVDYKGSILAEVKFNDSLVPFGTVIKTIKFLRESNPKGNYYYNSITNEGSIESNIDLTQTSIGTITSENNMRLQILFEYGPALPSMEVGNTFVVS